MSMSRTPSPTTKRNHNDPALGVSVEPPLQRRVGLHIYKTEDAQWVRKYSEGRCLRLEASCCWCRYSLEGTHLQRHMVSVKPLLPTLFRLGCWWVGWFYFRESEERMCPRRCQLEQSGKHTSFTATTQFLRVGWIIFRQLSIREGHRNEQGISGALVGYSLRCGKC